MTSEQLIEFRMSIYATLNQIQARAVTARRDLLEASEAQPGINVERTDHARDEGELNTQLELHSRDLKLRNQLYGALQRISEGTFGFCESCEEGINPRRLQAHPAATHCVQCQTQEESARSTKKFVSLILGSPEFINLDYLVA